jgi:hypothetical protein
MKTCTTCNQNEVPTWAYQTCEDCMQAYVDKAIEMEGNVSFSAMQQTEIETLIKTPVKIHATVQVDVQNNLLF